MNPYVARVVHVLLRPVQKLVSNFKFVENSLVALHIDIVKILKIHLEGKFLEGQREMKSFLKVLTP